MAFYAPDELQAMGFGRLGRDVCIDRTVMIHGSMRIHLGDNVRVDAFSILSASGFDIVFDGHNHIGAGTYVFANGGLVRFELFSSASPGCRIFTTTDDFSLGMLRGPQLDVAYRQLKQGPVWFRENAGIGANVVVLPGCTLGINATVGAGLVVQNPIPDHSLAYERSPLKLHHKDPEVYRAVSEKAKAEIKSRGETIP